MEPVSGGAIRPVLSWTSAVMRLLPCVVLLVAIPAIPAFLFRPSAEGGNYPLTVLIYVGINTLLAIGLNLLMGYAGQVSLGHAAFYGIGAYTSAILTTQGVSSEIVFPGSVLLGWLATTAASLAMFRVESGRLMLFLAGMAIAAISLLFSGFAHPLPWSLAVLVCVGAAKALRLSPARLFTAVLIGVAFGWGALTLFRLSATPGAVSPWIAMGSGILVTGLVAYLLGVQALRLHGYYLAMATLGFGIIVSIVFVQWEALTGGTSGIYGIPNLSIAGKPIDNDGSIYLLVWSLVAVVLFLSLNIVHSRVGRAFRAVHGGEIAAATLGIDTSQYKVQVFVLSAALASVAGSLYAHTVTFISPEPFGFKFSVELVVMVVVGGMASVWGAIFGAGAITVLGEVLRGLGGISIGSHGATLADFDVILFGTILILIMIYLPAGLVRGTADAFKLALSLRRSRRRDAGAPRAASGGQERER